MAFVSQQDITRPDHISQEKWDSLTAEQKGILMETHMFAQDAERARVSDIKKRRERIAEIAMQGLLSSGRLDLNEKAGLARTAVSLADALIAELDGHGKAVS